MATNQADNRSVSHIFGPRKHPPTNSQASPEPPTFGKPYNPWKLFTGIWVPEALLRFDKISPTAKLIFGRLARYAGEDGRCFPGVATIAAAVGIRERRARVCLAELEKQKFIRRDLQNGRTTNYIFCEHPILFGESPPAGNCRPPRQYPAAPPGSILPPKRVREEKQKKKGESVCRSVVALEPEKTDRPTDNSLNILNAAIQESGICAKLNDTPSRALLERIRAKLNGNPPDALKVRIRLRFDAVTGLGMLEGLAGDVAAAQGMQPSEIQRARWILEHPTKHNEADKLWARLVLDDASEAVLSPETHAVKRLAMENLRRTGRIGG